MSKHVAKYTVSELAKHAGVSVRTLHHYDQIGLLKPAFVATNGYRYYGHAEALTLQEILFYQALDLPLKEIACLLQDGGDARLRLLQHRERLLAKQANMQKMIHTLDQTIAALDGDYEMTLNDLYAPFTKEKQDEYQKWLIAEYGPDMFESVQESNAIFEHSAPTVTDLMNELKDIESALVEAFLGGADPVPDLERHRQWVAKAWGRECSREEYAGLAQLYRAHPDFVARFEALAPRFSAWLPTEMERYSQGLA